MSETALIVGITNKCISQYMQPAHFSRAIKMLWRARGLIIFFIVSTSGVNEHEKLFILSFSVFRHWELMRCSSEQLEKGFVDFSIWGERMKVYTWR